MDRIPILRVGDTLLISVQVELHDTLVRQLQDDLLNSLSARPASGVVIDVSSVAVLDTFTARSLAQTAQMAKLMGTITVVAGLMPSVAITLTEMGFSATAFDTARDVDAALAHLATFAEDS